MEWHQQWGAHENPCKTISTSQNKDYKPINMEETVVK